MATRQQSALSACSSFQTLILPHPVKAPWHPPCTGKTSVDLIHLLGLSWGFACRRKRNLLGFRGSRDTRTPAQGPASESGMAHRWMHFAMTRRTPAGIRGEFTRACRCETRAVFLGRRSCVARIDFALSGPNVVSVSVESRGAGDELRVLEVAAGDGVLFLVTFTPKLRAVSRPLGV